MPCYGKEGGNGCRIYTVEGEIYEDKRRIETVINSFARFYGQSVPVIRKNYAAVLGCSNNIPLPFTASLVMVPLKMRYPQFENDSTSGYVNLGAVNGITAETASAGPQKFRCRIDLKGGFSFPVINSRANTAKQVNNGKLVLTHYYSLHSPNNSRTNTLVMEKAGEDALDKMATFARIFYLLLVDQPHPDQLSGSGCPYCHN